MGELADLATLGVDDLAEFLTGLAQRARRLSEEAAVVELHEILQSVRSAADRSSGPRLALLEVAESFLRVLARSDLGRSEFAVRRFCVEHSDEATGLFKRLLTHGRVTSPEVEAFPLEVRRDVEHLIELGVLRCLSDGVFDLRPSSITIVRDLIEPAAVRMWRKVTTCRAHVALAHMKEPIAAGYLASQLGITTAQATHFLRTDRIVPDTTPALLPAIEAIPARPARRVVYTRDTAPEGLSPSDWLSKIHLATASSGGGWSQPDAAEPGLTSHAPPQPREAIN